MRVARGELSAQRALVYWSTSGGCDGQVEPHHRKPSSSTSGPPPGCTPHLSPVETVRSHASTARAPSGSRAREAGPPWSSTRSRHSGHPLHGRQPAAGDRAGTVGRWSRTRAGTGPQPATRVPHPRSPQKQARCAAARTTARATPTAPPFRNLGGARRHFGWKAAPPNRRARRLQIAPVHVVHRDRHCGLVGRVADPVRRVRGDVDDPAR